MKVIEILSACLDGQIAATFLISIATLILSDVFWGLMWLLIGFLMFSLKMVIDYHFHVQPSLGNFLRKKFCKEENKE